MPQTALMGPDGQQAKDMRGTPLTMEEMLRRNGIVGVGNNVAMMGPSGSQAAPQAGPPSAVQAAMSQRAGMSSPAVTPVAHAGPPGDGDGADSETGNDPAQDAQMAQLAAQGVDPNTVKGMEVAGLVAAGTAAAYALYRMRAGAAVDATSAVPSASTPSINNSLQQLDNAAPQPALEAPMKRVGDSTKKALSGNAAKAIEAPSKQLPSPTGNSRKATAQALAERAARGGPTDVGTIAGQAPIRTIEEGATNGVARTLGLPQGLLETLKANPGLMRTLARKL